MQVLLKVTHGPHRGKTFSFDSHDTFIVGRGKNAHFQLPKLDSYFSRNHFMLEVNPPHCLLVDMSSRNGTYVNAKRVEQAALQDGDLIQGGKTAIRVAIQQEEEVGDAVPPAAAPQPDRLPPPWAPRTPAEDQSPPLQVVSTEQFSPVPHAGHAPPQEYLEKIRSQPQPIAGYQIIEELGQGGMGTVFLAWREATGRLVALKTIKPDAAASQAHCKRFLRETEILREIRHPHIVAYEDAGLSDGTLYFAMEYVRGRDVRQLLVEQGGPLPVGHGVRLACQALEALADAHSRGIVHRDIKPANLLVTVSDGRSLLKLADFGLARMFHSSQLSGLTMMGDTGGTIPYMAPEQITNYRDCEPPVDQYSAAATLYHLLTNRFIYDFPKDIGSRLLMVLQEDPVPILKRRPDLPAELAEAVHRGLARNPSVRFANCMLFREALLPFYNAG
jgi:eukaryotic-like serine/threonine-protein kinase